MLTLYINRKNIYFMSQAPLLKNTAVQALFKTLAEKNPHPQGELYYTNPYTLLVAVVLSARATDKGVNKATKPLFEKVSTPQDMLAFGLENLKESVKTIGLFNAKAENIIKLSECLVKDYRGQVPDQREDLMSLPGVGRKTANVVLNVAFGQETIAVDTHLFRVSNRTGLCHGKTPLEIEECLEKRVPKEFKRHCHHWLILHGRYICKSQKPLCPACPIEKICLYPHKTKMLLKKG